jgi:hypothetical protein
MEMLSYLRIGLRAIPSLSHKLGLDSVVVQELLVRGMEAGLIADANRLTRRGFEVLRDSKASGHKAFDRDIYVPRFCVDQETVQPLALATRADSTVTKVIVDGECGQHSLEKTAENPASPALSVIAQGPSMTRLGHDAPGPRTENGK